MDKEGIDFPSDASQMTGHGGFFDSLNEKQSILLCEMLKDIIPHAEISL